MERPERIIDANANRAREALRVMEDAARFLLDDAALAGGCKALRHDLASALASLPWGGVLAPWRDTPGDVGREIEGAGEFARRGSRGVVLAAGRRLGESLRSIEEYAKALQRAGVAREVEALRYRAYECERALAMAMGTGRAEQWSLCVLISEALCAHHRWDEVARRAIEGGADCLQLREKDLPAREIERRARALVEIARPRGVAVVVNDRVDIAVASGADGVHLGQDDMSVASARRAGGADLLVGVSVSDIGQAERARADGADSCGVGAMFPTTTKHKDAIAGPELLRAYLAHEPALPPHLAIGGITPENIGLLVDVGARGVAVSSCVCGSPDPAGVCADLRGALARAPGVAGLR